MSFPFQLDMVFTQEGAMLSVATREFPGCIGIGYNQGEALSDMRRAIKIYLKEQIEKAVDRLFTAPIQEHISLGAKLPQKCISFDMGPALGLEAFVQPRKHTVLSFALPRYGRVPDPEPVSADVEIFINARPQASPVRNLFEQLGLGLDLTGVRSGAVPYVAGQDDGLVVGVPLNFN